MKKIKIMFLTIVLLFSMFIPSVTYAAEVVPYEVAPCPLYGFHQMELIGICSVHDEDSGEYTVCEVPPTSTAYTEIGLFVRGYSPDTKILSGYYIEIPSSAVEYMDSMFVPGYRY